MRCRVACYVFTLPRLLRPILTRAGVPGSASIAESRRNRVRFTFPLNRLQAAQISGVSRAQKSGPDPSYPEEILEDAARAEVDLGVDLHAGDEHATLA